MTELTVNVTPVPGLFAVFSRLRLPCMHTFTAIFVPLFSLLVLNRYGSSKAHLLVPFRRAF